LTVRGAPGAEQEAGGGKGFRHVEKASRRLRASSVNPRSQKLDLGQPAATMTEIRGLLPAAGAIYCFSEAR
jgi:hypothetical protein